MCIRDRSYTEEKIPKEFTRIGRGFNEMVVHIENLIEQVKQASAEQRMAELSALEAQIDPHFLYNTLDAINWKAIENEQYEISEMIGALADILRYAVKNAGAETSLEHALSWVDSYIMIQSAKMCIRDSTKRTGRAFIASGGQIGGESQTQEIE